MILDVDAPVTTPRTRNGEAGELALSPGDVGSLHDDDTPQTRAQIVAWIHGEPFAGITLEGGTL